MDPQRRTLDELELVDGSFVERAHGEGGAVFSSPLLPGLAIDLGRVWPRPPQPLKDE